MRRLREWLVVMGLAQASLDGGSGAEEALEKNAT